MKKILFPTDFSKTANSAFIYAIALSKILDARVDLLHIYHIPFKESASLPEDHFEQLLAEKKRSVDDQFETLIASAKKGHFGKPKSIYGIQIVHDIVTHAEFKNYDLIVMGTKGEHNRRETLFGSVTSDVMIKANCPVLVVPEYAAFKAIRQIAYATSFEPADEQAIEELRAFAKSCEAEIHFLHINTKSPKGKTEEVVVIDHYPLEDTDFSVVNDPSITEGIERFIEEKEIDLLALYRPNKKLWERLFNKSLTKQMALSSKTPLIVFHQ